MYRRSVVMAAYVAFTIALAAGSLACGGSNVGANGPVEDSAAAEASPFVVGLSPTAGPRGSRVTITGRDLTPVIAVCFGPSPGLDLRVNSEGNRITVIAPVGSGTVKVTLVSGFRISESGHTFTYTRSAVASSAVPSASPCSEASPEPSA